jgi:hypothetical protein
MAAVHYAAMTAALRPLDGGPGYGLVLLNRVKAIDLSLVVTPSKMYHCKT